MHSRFFLLLIDLKSQINLQASKTLKAKVPKFTNGKSSICIDYFRLCEVLNIKPKTKNNAIAISPNLSCSVNKIRPIAASRDKIARAKDSLFILSSPYSYNGCFNKLPDGWNRFVVNS